MSVLAWIILFNQFLALFSAVHGGLLNTQKTKPNKITQADKNECGLQVSVYDWYM